jgi:glyoxylase-like metal-dependent hydrolase (beta-lactamase superfamily II)/ferredoxin
MALAKLRRPENVPGDFYVDSTCIDCDLCRQIAPSVFADAADQSAVFHQPESPGEDFAALKALVTCPTASIGTAGRQSRAAAAAASYPEQVEDEVYFCGYASESSYGASSYLIVREQGNVLVDSPRFTKPLVRRISSMGGISMIFLTHIDDVADHALWAREFQARRIMHERDCRRLPVIEHKLHGDDPEEILAGLTAIPTPGHTRGHTCLLYRDRFLFTGDHLWWSPHRGSLYASRSVCWFSWPEQQRSLEKLSDFRFEWVLPGHGRRHHAPQAEMRLRLEQCVAASLSS